MARRHKHADDFSVMVIIGGIVAALAAVVVLYLAAGSECGQEVDCHRNQIDFDQ